MKNAKRYSDLWRDVIRPDILKRDGYRCKHTGCKVRHKAIGYYSPMGEWIECDTFMSAWAEGKGFIVQKISLQVAHLDQDPANNNYSNLISFCPRHHFEHDRPFNLIKRIAKSNNPAG